MKTIRYLLSIAGVAMILVSGCKKDATETGQQLNASDASDATQAATVTFLYNGDSVTYGVITSKTTGRKWLDRNLGAKRKATAYNDYQAYGDLFQWGRPDDGHQLINWTSSTSGTPVNATTTKLATTDKPKTSKFILADNNANPWTGDWRSDNNMNRWNMKAQGPCPKGWHVPTDVEWAAEISSTQGGTATSGGITYSGDAYSLLKLTVAGYHSGDGSGAGPGTMNHAGDRGGYWSSTSQFVSQDNFSWGGEVSFSGFADISNTSNCTGKSVRCIKN